VRCVIRVSCVADLTEVIGVEMGYGIETLRAYASPALHLLDEFSESDTMQTW
jgi:hypothetical protein